jgi:hypothetical protein
MRDFRDEVPGYLENGAICAALATLQLRPGVEHVGDNMRRAYELLVESGWLDARELELLDAWLNDLRSVTSAARRGRAA